MTTAKIELPPKLIPVFSGIARYRGAYGGRGSGKTMSFALMTAVRAYMFAESGVSGVVLCGREFMNSLEESSLEEVKQAIKSMPWLNNYFDIGEKYIRTKNRMVSYVFAGLRHNLDSIKSKAKILIAWIDEAEGVSQTAWDKLLPTVRSEGSEVWVTWNPEKEGSATDKLFRQGGFAEDGEEGEIAKIVEINYGDNPWFPEVLDKLRRRQRRTMDANTYSWIWEGAYLLNSNAQVLNGKWRVDSFEPQDDWIPYHGLDFGFSQDPTAAVKAWVDHDANVLYIEREAGKVGLEIDDTQAHLERHIPGISNHVVRADSARPESISYLRKHGMGRIVGAKKGKGSVEDGIAHLRQYDEIVVHERCANVIYECQNYSYKVDKNTGDVLTAIIDKDNHYIDALRYALEPLIKSKQVIFEAL